MITVTVCPRSSDPFYVVTYYIKWVNTSWTCCTLKCTLRAYASNLFLLVLVVIEHMQRYLQFVE